MSHFSPDNSTSADSLIRVHHVSKSFQGISVLSDISFDVHPQEVMAIIGTSGCGKSTLLRLICGLETPDSGDIILSDTNTAMVFQYSALFDSMSVFDNVAFSLTETPDTASGGIGRKHMLPPETIRETVLEKLRLVGLEGTENKYPNELSGGMQKRVSFARAIVSNPKIILYDEPTAGLDPIASTVIEDYILKLRDEFQAASVVVTHQHSTIHRTADRICLLHGGLIRWMGTPDEMLHTDNPYARQFAEASLQGPLSHPASFP